MRQHWQQRPQWVPGAVAAKRMSVHVYVWADLFSPQSSSHSVLSQQVYASRDAMMCAGASHCSSLYVGGTVAVGHCLFEGGGLNA